MSDLWKILSYWNKKEEVIDGYSQYCGDNHDIINTVTGVYLKENPFIELHDQTEGFLRYE